MELTLHQAIRLYCSGNPAIAKAAWAFLISRSGEEFRELCGVLDTGDRDAREVAYAALGEYQTPEAFEHLKRAADDPDIVVRRQAAQPLAKHGEAGLEVIQKIWRKSDPDEPELRKAIVRAASQCGPQAAWFVVEHLDLHRPGYHPLEGDLVRLGQAAVDALMAWLSGTHEEGVEYRQEALGHLAELSIEPLSQVLQGPERFSELGRRLGHCAQILLHQAGGSHSSDYLGH